MLTLDEAITRFTALSKANRSRAESYNRGEDYELIKAKECETCADECDQVASWLEELKRYKAQKLVIKVDYDKAHSLKKMLRYAEFGVACPDSQYKVIPLVSERPQGEWVDREYRRYLPRDAEPDYNNDTYDEKTHSVMSTHIVCSNCGAERHFYHNFCGKCGADMRGGKE